MEKNYFLNDGETLTFFNIKGDDLNIVATYYLEELAKTTPSINELAFFKDVTDDISTLITETKLDDWFKNLPLSLTLSIFDSTLEYSTLDDSILLLNEIKVLWGVKNYVEKFIIYWVRRNTIVAKNIKISLN